MREGGQTCHLDLSIAARFVCAAHHALVARDESAVVPRLRAGAYVRLTAWPRDREKIVAAIAEASDQSSYAARRLLELAYRAYAPTD